jgi:hypothetical protein
MVQMYTLQKSRPVIITYTSTNLFQHGEAKSLHDMVTLLFSVLTFFTITITTAVNNNNIGGLKYSWSSSRAVPEGGNTHRQHHLAKKRVTTVHQIFWSVKLNHLEIKKKKNLSYTI